MKEEKYIDKNISNKECGMKFLVSVCMGSSCYPRGNRKILIYLRQLIEENNWQDFIELQGNLCGGNCKEGPVVTIDGIVYTKVTEAKVKEILLDKVRSRG
jgi:NADH:ubiquinone oxidoreductase subunit E